MPRKYIKIRQHEEELLKMKEQGLTHQEMANRLGYQKSQIKEFFCAYNKRQKKIAAGITIKPKGRPRKDGFNLPPSIQQLSKLTQLQYKLNQQEQHIKQLEMENELMRDFLSLTERK